MSNNDEARMTNDETRSNAQMTNVRRKRSAAFGFRHSFVIRHSAFVIFLALAVPTDAAPAPSAKVIPFHLTQTGSLVRYSFSDPEEVLQLRLGENGSRLDLVTDTGAEKFPAEKLNEKIRGTGISYEDLALKFLYWPNARVLSDETVRTRSCWKLQVVAPSRNSKYWNVVIWVDKTSGALMRMEAYAWDGKLAKRFEVISAQKIDNRWFLKQMRVEELQPGTNKVQARTYLEIKR